MAFAWPLSDYVLFDFFFFRVDALVDKRVTTVTACVTAVAFSFMFSGICLCSFVVHHFTLEVALLYM
jgi:hypothetical protein